MFTLLHSCNYTLQSPQFLSGLCFPLQQTVSFSLSSSHRPLQREPHPQEKSIGMKKARQLFEAKEEYFTRNGAILLEKQITCNKARDTEPIKIFFAKDIQQTTNNYNPKPRKQ